MDHDEEQHSVIASIVVTGLEEIDAIGRHPIHHPVLMGQSTRPYARGKIFERFRLSYSRKGIPRDRLDEVESPKCYLSVSLDPVAKILDEFRVEDGVTNSSSGRP